MPTAQPIWQCSPMGISIEPAGLRDVLTASDALAKAFQANPLMRWLLPSERGRRRRLPWLFLLELLSDGLPEGAVDLARLDGRIVGCAIWKPPGTWPISMRRQVILAPATLATLGRRANVMGQFGMAMVKVHPREPHWYLQTVGVHPEAQGGGVGGALLESRLKIVDAAGLPAYLEASSPALTPYYERWGFEQTGTPPLPAGAPVVTTMWRAPVTPTRPDR